MLLSVPEVRRKCLAGVRMRARSLLQGSQGSLGSSEEPDPSTEARRCKADRRAVIRHFAWRLCRFATTPGFAIKKAASRAPSFHVIHSSLLARRCLHLQLPAVRKNG